MKRSPRSVSLSSSLVLLGNAFFQMSMSLLRLVLTTGAPSVMSAPRSSQPHWVRGKERREFWVEVRNMSSAITITWRSCHGYTTATCPQQSPLPGTVVMVTLLSWLHYLNMSSAITITWNSCSGYTTSINQYVIRYHHYLEIETEPHLLPINPLVT